MRWKKRLVKDARLSLPLTEAMKIARLTSMLLDGQSSWSVIAKAKAEAWQTTCSSLSPRSNPRSVHSLLRSIAGSPSRLLTLLTSPTVLLAGNRLWSMLLT